MTDPIDPTQAQGAQIPQIDTSGDTTSGGISERVFAMLLGLLGASNEAIYGFLMPLLQKEALWQKAASGIYALLTNDPGKLTANELDAFAEGFQNFNAILNDPKAPPSLKQWIKSIQNNPKFQQAFQSIYNAIKNLQQIERKYPHDKKKIKEAWKGVVDAVKTLQGMAKTDENAFMALKYSTKTQVASTTALSNVTYAKAMQMVNYIQSLTQYDSKLVKENADVKARLIQGILS